MKTQTNKPGNCVPVTRNCKITWCFSQNTENGVNQKIHPSR